MCTAMFPPNWLAFCSLLPAILVGIMIIVFSDLSNSESGIKSNLKRYGIYFTATPVLIVLAWVTLVYTLPASFVSLSGDYYMKKHQISSKNVNCAHNCKYWVGISNLRSFLKYGVRVDKRIFEKISIGDSVIVEGKKGVLGLRVNKISTLRNMNLE